MAAVDYFLKLEGVPGESQDKTHKDEIQMESWSWSESNSGTGGFGGGSGAGKVQPGDFHFVMKVSKASPLLFQHCASGKHIPTAIVTARKAGGDAQDFLKWEFEEVFISSYSTGGSESSDVVPTDQVSFNFAKLKMTYKEQDKTGALKGGPVKWYNFKTSEKG
jgi:type VI secretion system secreted protein Hcp